MSSCQQSMYASTSAASHAATRRSNTARASSTVSAQREREDEPVDERAQPVAHVRVELRCAPVSASFAFAACVRATASDASMTSGTATSATTFSTSARSSFRPSRSRSSVDDLERVDHRQRVDAFVHVVAGGLAELGHAAGDVEHVVDDLEAHAEVMAELRERVERVGGHVADHPADAAGGGHQRRGLALDRRVVRLLAAVRVEQVLQLEHLTAAELTDRVDASRPATSAPSDAASDGRLGEEEVAGEDRDDVRPARVDARHAAPGLGLVDHVVVVERPEVDELHRARAGDRAVGRRAARAVGRVGRAQGERGPEPLAARRRAGGPATSPRNRSSARTASARRASTRSRSPGRGARPDVVDECHRRSAR